MQVTNAYTEKKFQSTDHTVNASVSLPSWAGSAIFIDDG